MLSTTRATRTKAQYHEAASATAFEVLLKNIGPFLGLKAITFRHQRERERKKWERGRYGYGGEECLEIKFFIKEKMGNDGCVRVSFGGY